MKKVLILLIVTVLVSCKCAERAEKTRNMAKAFAQSQCASYELRGNTGNGYIKCLCDDSSSWITEGYYCNESICAWDNNVPCKTNNIPKTDTIIVHKVDTVYKELEDESYW